MTTPSSDQFLLSIAAGPWPSLLPQEAREALGLAQGCPRQELVFIGIDLDRAGITSALDQCLASDSEQADADARSDPFQPWPDSAQFMLTDLSRDEVAF